VDVAACLSKYPRPRRPGALWNLRAESDSDTDSVTRGLSSSVQVCLCERARRRPSFSNRKCKSDNRFKKKWRKCHTIQRQVRAYLLGASRVQYASPGLVEMCLAVRALTHGNGPLVCMQILDDRIHVCNSVFIAEVSFCPRRSHAVYRQGVGGVGGEQHTCAPARSRRGHRDAQA
jgi:hypothetical protein